MGTSNALGLLFEINADPSKAQAALDQFTTEMGTKLPKAAGAAGEAMTQGMDKGGASSVQARYAVMGLTEQFGIHLPRALATTIAQTETFQEIATLAFGAASVIFLVEHLGNMIKKIGDAKDSLFGFGEGFKAIMKDAVKDSDDALTHFRGLTTESKITAAYFNIAQTQMAITAVQAHAALVPLIEAGKQLQITWWQALIPGPAAFVTALYKAVKATQDTTGATKELAALYVRLNAQIKDLDKLEIEAGKERDQQAKKDRAAEEAESEALYKNVMARIKLRDPIVSEEEKTDERLLASREKLDKEYEQFNLAEHTRGLLASQKYYDELTRQNETAAKHRWATLEREAKLEAQYTAYGRALSEQRQKQWLSEGEVMRSGLMMFNQAMSMGIANALVYSTSVGQAMGQALKSTLASIAAESLIRAMYNTALGFYYLALTWGIPNPAAIAAFQAAAVFGAIGGAAAMAGRAVPGGSAGGSGTAASTGVGTVPPGTRGTGAADSSAGSAAGGNASGQRGPTTIVHLQMSGKWTAQDGRDLADLLNPLVEHNNVRLVASESHTVVRKH